jgi:hypothetical protein
MRQWECVGLWFKGGKSIHVTHIKDFLPVPSETHDVQHFYLMTQEQRHYLFRVDYKDDLYE